MNAIAAVWRRKAKSGKRRVTGAMLLCMALAHCGQAADNAHIELIRMVAIRHKASTEEITTWQGNVSVHDLSLWGDSNRQETSSSASFVFDRAQGATRWNWTTEQSVIAEKGKPPWRLPRSINNAMLKDGVLYRFRIHDAAKEKPPHRLAMHDPTKEPRAFLKNDFDPTWFLTNFGEDMSDRLMALYQWAKNPEEYPDFSYNLRREENLLTLELPRDTGINRYVFDLNKGCNLVSYYGRDPIVTEEWSYAYEQIEDIWVLNGIDYENTQKSETGESLRTFSKTIRWTQNKVNHALDPSEFSLEKLGVSPGDKVNDERAGIIYTYRTAGADEGLKDLFNRGADLQNHAGAEANEAADQQWRNRAQSPNAPDPMANHNQSAGGRRAIDHRSLLGNIGKFIIALVVALLLLSGGGLLLKRRKEAGRP
jgi:hypothetical protein